MNENDIKQKIFECLNNTGISISTFETKTPIADIVPDSLTFITLIIELRTYLTNGIRETYPRKCDRLKKQAHSRASLWVVKHPTDTVNPHLISTCLKLILMRQVLCAEYSANLPQVTAHVR